MGPCALIYIPHMITRTFMIRNRGIGLPMYLLKLLRDFTLGRSRKRGLEHIKYVVLSEAGRVHVGIGMNLTPG